MTAHVGRRLLLLGLISLVGSTGLALRAQAQPYAAGADGGSGAALGDCACHDTIEAADANQCAVISACPGADECNISADCTNGICVAGACPFNVCFEQTSGCGGECPVASSQGNIVLCNLIPTLSQWGLLLFGLLLLTAIFLTIRRRGLPTHTLASLLVLMAVGVIGVGASYAEIQSQRVCEAERLR